MMSDPWMEDEGQQKAEERMRGIAMALLSAKARNAAFPVEIKALRRLLEMSGASGSGAIAVAGWVLPNGLVDKTAVIVAEEGNLLLLVGEALGGGAVAAGIEAVGGGPVEPAPQMIVILVDAKGTVEGGASSRGRRLMARLRKGDGER